MANNKPKNQITPDSRKGMPTRGRSKRILILEAIREESLMGMKPDANNEESEKAFFTHVARQASNPESEHFGMCLKLLADKGWASVKPSAECVEYDFDESAKPHKQAAQIMKAISDGVIPPDIGSTLVNSIASMLKIEEVTELADRIQALEEKTDG